MLSLLLFLLYVTGATVAGPELCGSPVLVDDTCPTDCSQKNERILGDKTFFNCTIGGIDSINKFKKSKPKYFEPNAEMIFDAPTLLDISFYRKEYPGEDKRNPALKINFLLPKGVEPSSTESLVPEAVLLKFESIEDARYQDDFYYQCPRYRIFNFHNYQPYSVYDLRNPRNLTFDCLVGLNDSEKKGMLRVYKITLETVQGRSAVYTVTVNVITGDMTDDNVKSRQLVIATELNEKNRSIYVVAQKVTDIFGYVFQLKKLGQTATNSVKKLPPETNVVMFDHVEPGSYVVKVGVRSGLCSGAPLCMNSTSYIVQVPWPADSVHYADNAEDGLKIVAMVLVCLVVIIVVIPVVWIFWRRKKEKTTVHGWLLHPYKPGTDEFDVVDKLVDYLEEACNCCLEKCLPDDGHDATSESKLRDRCDTILGKSTKFALIVIAKDAFIPNACCSYENFYSYAVTKAVDKKKHHNNLRIFPVDFLFSKGPLPSPLEDTKCFHMMPDLNDLTKEIKNLNDSPLSSQTPIPTDASKKLLVEAINKLVSTQTIPKQALVPVRSRSPANYTPKDEHEVQGSKHGPNLPKRKEQNFGFFQKQFKIFNVSIEDVTAAEVDSLLLRDKNPESSDYVSTTSPEVTRNMRFKNVPHVPDNRGYVSASEIHPLLSKAESKHVPVNSDYVLATSAQGIGKEPCKNVPHVPEKQISWKETCNNVPDNSGYVSTTSPQVTRKEPCKTVPGNSGYVSTTSPQVTRKEPCKTVPGNSGYVSTTSPQVTRREPCKTVPGNSGYVSTTSPQVTRREPCKTVPGNSGYVSTTSPQVTRREPCKKVPQIPDNSGYVSTTETDIQKMPEKTDMIVRPKNTSSTPQHCSGEYVCHDFIERWQPQIPKQSALPVDQDYLNEEFLPRTIAAEPHTGTNHEYLHPFDDGGGFGRKRVDDHSAGYVSHEGVTNFPRYHGEHLHESRHGRLEQEGMNYMSKQSREHAPSAGHVPYVDHSVLMGQGVHHSWKNRLPQHAEFVQENRCSERWQFPQEHSLYQSHRHDRQATDCLELRDCSDRYTCHTNSGPHATVHDHYGRGHQPYVSCNDFDENGVWHPAHSGYSGDYDRLHGGFHDSSPHAEYTEFPKVPFCFGNHTNDTNHVGYVSTHLHTQFNPPMCERQLSNRSDSLLSPDYSLEYETSYGSDPNSFDDCNEMMIDESERIPRGYVAHNLERQRPIGSSDNSIAAAKMNFRAIDPIGLEKSFTRTEVGGTMNNKTRRSQTPPASGFLKALSQEGQLREEYDNFDPIPPEDDESTAGSITDVMDHLKKINSS